MSLDSEKASASWTPNSPEDEARTRQFLTTIARDLSIAGGPTGRVAGNLGPAKEEDWSDSIEATEFGPARRLRSPIIIGDTPLHWDRSAVKLGSSPPAWQ
jgi:hypothetical protein